MEEVMETMLDTKITMLPVIEHEQVIWMPGLVFEQRLRAHRSDRHRSGGRRWSNRFASCRGRREGNRQRAGHQERCQGMPGLEWAKRVVPGH